MSGDNNGIGKFNNFEFFIINLEQKKIIIKVYLFEWVNFIQSFFLTFSYLFFNSYKN